MSLSKPRQGGLKNPATKFITWKGGDDQGIFVYYDKETKENVEVDFNEDPFFILDKDLFSIKGYNEPQKEQIISNEVRSVDDILTVKAYKDKQNRIIHHGPYSKLKEAVKASSYMKYTRCVYAMWQGELVHIALSGAAFAEFMSSIEASPTQITENWVTLTGIEAGKKGAVKYQKPKFAFGDKISEDDYNEAFKLDSEILQPYLESYLKSKSKDEGSDESQDIDVTKWRDIETPNGLKLCELTLHQVEDLAQSVAEEGAEGPLFEYVTQAIRDYSIASRDWKDKKGKDGKELGSYSYEEMKKLHETVPKSNPYFIFIEAAMNELEPPKSEPATLDSGEDWGDEGPPF